MNRREVHYHVRRLPTCVVVVASVPGELEVELVPHLVHHSPTGMEFGYAGSGPADLALSLLTFHLQADPRQIKAILIGRGAAIVDLPAIQVVEHYQAFKLDCLDGYGDDRIDLTGFGIDRWLEIRAEKAADPGCTIDVWRMP